MNDVPMKSARSRFGIGDVLALVGHPVGQGARLLVAPVGADQVGVVDIGVIDVLARLHLRLQLFDHVAFADQVVRDLDAGDGGEGRRQHLRFVFDAWSMVSDTTLMSMPAKGFAASMNHCISASWAARSSVDRSPISASRNVLASSIPANAVPAARQAGQGLLVDVRRVPSHYRSSLKVLRVRSERSPARGRSFQYSPSRRSGTRRWRRPRKEQEPTTGWDRQAPAMRDE